MESIGLYLDNSWTRIDILVKTRGPRIPQTAEQVLHKELSMSVVPSGNLLHNYGKSPFFMGKSPISMVIFHSYHSYVTVITRGYHGHSRRMTGWMVWIMLRQHLTVPCPSKVPI